MDGPRALQHRCRGKVRSPPRTNHVFGLGTVTFEVRNGYHGRSLYGFETRRCTSLQLFTGQVPSQEIGCLSIVTKSVVEFEGERSPRFPKGKRFHLLENLREECGLRWPTSRRKDPRRPHSLIFGEGDPGHRHTQRVHQPRCGFRGAR